MFEKILSITESKDDKHNIINFFGVKLSVKKPFPFGTISVKKVYSNSKKINYKHKTAAVFSTFDNEGRIPANTVRYLKEIKKYVDFVVVVGDNPIFKSELRKVRKYADVVIYKRHKTYDFGSYKIGYFELKKLGVLNKVEKLLFFNDSVCYIGKDLNGVFAKAHNKNFYGILMSQQGLKLDSSFYQTLHLQSWFLMFSKEIFNSDWFLTFIKNIRRLKRKKEIIINYEMGISRLVLNHGYELNSYYPYDCEYHYNPDRIYASLSDVIFIKKRYLK